MNRKQAEGVMGAVYVLEQSGKIDRPTVMTLMASLQEAGFTLSRMAGGMNQVVQDLGRGYVALCEQTAAKKPCPWYYKVLQWLRMRRS